jgi:hypothetical protein
MASPVPRPDVGVFDIVIHYKCFGFEPGDRVRCRACFPKKGDIVTLRINRQWKLAKFRGRYLELANGQRLIGAISQIKGVLTRASL